MVRTSSLAAEQALAEALLADPTAAQLRPDPRGAYAAYSVRFVKLPGVGVLLVLLALGLFYLFCERCAVNPQLPDQRFPRVVVCACIVLPLPTPR